MYTDVASKVCVDGELSLTIKENHQGGLTLTEIFTERSNPVLKAAANIPGTMHIGYINAYIPTWHLPLLYNASWLIDCRAGS